MPLSERSDGVPLISPVNLPRSHLIFTSSFTLLNKFVRWDLIAHIIELLSRGRLSYAAEAAGVQLDAFVCLKIRFSGSPVGPLSNESLSEAYIVRQEQKIRILKYKSKKHLKHLNSPGNERSVKGVLQWDMTVIIFTSRHAQNNIVDALKAY